MPPLPKNPATRQRRNKSTSHATLPAGPNNIKAPALPDHFVVVDGVAVAAPWHAQVAAAWAVWWASPMATEWVDADVPGLFLLAELMQMFYEKPSANLASEIRQQRMAFGLTPIDRRRLQWEIERGQAAEDRGKRRRATPVPAGGQDGDVRAALRAV